MINASVSRVKLMLAGVPGLGLVVRVVTGKLQQPVDTRKW